jgi:hypothetical protein
VINIITDIENLYPSRYLKPGDLPGKQVTVTIANVTIEEFGQAKEKKAVLSIVGYSKRLVLNKTNVKAIAKAYGGNFAGWIGKLIVLYVTTTDFGGDTFDVIRVRPPGGGAGSGDGAAAMPAATTSPNNDMNDAVEF